MTLFPDAIIKHGAMRPVTQRCKYWLWSNTNAGHMSKIPDQIFVNDDIIDLMIKDGLIVRHSLHS